MKGVRKTMRIAFRTPYRMSDRQESQKHPDHIFAHFTVYLTLRYHYEYYVIFENHYFDLGMRCAWFYGPPSHILQVWLNLKENYES